MSLVEPSKFKAMIFFRRISVNLTWMMFLVDDVSSFIANLLFRYFPWHTRYYLEKELVCLFSTTKKHTNSIIQPKHEGKHLHLPPELSPNPLGFRSTDTVGHREMICFGSMFRDVETLIFCRFFLERLYSQPQNWGGGNNGEDLPVSPFFF